MNEQPQPVTRMELDWLAEGEMDRDEQNQLLARLDQEVDGWKRCALALLETQALSRSMNEIHQSRLPATCHENGFGTASIAQAEPESKSDVQKARSTMSPARGLAWATAAGLLFATGLWLGAQRVPPPLAAHPDTGRTAAVVDHRIATAIAGQDPQTLLKINNAVQRLSVSDSVVIALVGFEQETELVVLPIIQSALLERQLTQLPTPSLNRETSQRLRDAGWQVQPAREFVSLHLPNGTNQVMPVNLLNYHYVGREIF